MKKTSLVLLVLFLAACQHQAAAPPAGKSVSSLLTGKIIESGTGTPVEGAYVYAYRETNTHFFGPPNYMSTPSGADGLYTMEIVPGKYYVFARKRMSGTYQGPLNKEDWYGEPDTRTSDIGPGKTILNLSIQKLEGQQLYRPERIFAKSPTSISGRILDLQGRPVFAAFAFAYRNRFEKGLPPAYGSTATDFEGRYILYLDEGGDYIVGARTKAKEPPEKGELVGFYRQDRETPISIGTGDALRNVDITIVPFTGTPEVKPGNMPLRQ